MNRIALHQSTVHPLTPVELVDVARQAGLDAIGLRVAMADEVQQWWSRGIGSPMLNELVDALLASRVTLLDVGRVQLGPELRSVDYTHPYMRVLEVGTRLGAQFVTARAVTGHDDDPATLFGMLAELAERYHLRPLMSAVADTAVDTLDRALEVIDGTGGGVVLNVHPHHDDAEELEETIVELGERLGYVRLLARDLETGSERPGLLATLPPHVPVVIGSDQPGHLDNDQTNRATAMRTTIDAMVRHPRAAHRT